MTRINRTFVILSLAAALTAGATGCTRTSPTDASTTEAPASSQSFPFSGHHLTVLSDYGKVDVREGSAGTITVDRRVTAVGKRPADPTWRLDGDTLDLGTVCDDGFVGLCEVTYAVTVPKGTKVDVRD